MPKTRPPYPEGSEGTAQIREMRRGCEQEHEQLRTLLTDAYDHCGDDDDLYGRIHGSGAVSFDEALRQVGGQGELG